MMKKLNPQKPINRRKGSQNIASKDALWGKTCPLSPTEGTPWLSVDEKIYQWDLAEAVDNGDRFLVPQYQQLIILLSQTTCSIAVLGSKNWFGFLGLIIF